METKWLATWIKEWIDVKAQAAIVSLQHPQSIVFANRQDLTKIIGFFYTTKETEEDSQSRQEVLAYLGKRAQEVRHHAYGNKVFFRGLIEISNICARKCYYCGISASQTHIERYRLTKEEILKSCTLGYELGYRSFVLQGGEDPYFDQEKLVEIVTLMKQKYPEIAITLAMGELEPDAYQALAKAGADRYLLRHETATKEHYEKLHPADMTLENRVNCLKTIKQLGFQVGAGFMVGSPYQTLAHLVEDLMFLQDLRPHMVGIGPFVPADQTKFAEFPSGTVDLTLVMLGLTRLLLPTVLLPATTALGTIASDGRMKALRFGANVVMPNLSPQTARERYQLYNDKIFFTEETHQYHHKLVEDITKAGNEVVLGRGDHSNFAAKTSHKINFVGKEQFVRTQLLLGENGIATLSLAHVAIFGVGGVGSFVAEALVRSGLGEITLVDPDCVQISNINRQIMATHSVVGQLKIEVMKQRLLDINPELVIHIKPIFFDEETLPDFDFSSFDYIVDAIDSVKSKVLLIYQAFCLHQKIISSMGAGNKLNPLDFKVADIYETNMCPLAKVVRQNIRKLGVTKLKVVYSEENPIVSHFPTLASKQAKVPGSIAFVPSVVGLVIASEVVKDLLN